MNRLFKLFLSVVWRYYKKLINYIFFAFTNRNDKYYLIYRNILEESILTHSKCYVAEKDIIPINPLVKIIAFYLPQFHPIPENDMWWGKGFTEWTNVSRAVPQFIGHYQPRLPGELGFYDLRVPEILHRQVEIAKKYGIYGFCFYYYWFNGKKLLELPFKRFIEDKQLDFPFCLCWANENWTRRWDGKEHEILISQRHSLESDINFIEHLLPIFSDKRYIRVNGQPLLIVYRANIMPDPVRTTTVWRKYCKNKGENEPFLVAAQTFGFYDPRTVGFDAAVEFPPHNISVPEMSHIVTILNPNYNGEIYCYEDVIRYMTKSNETPYLIFKTVFPSWDNEARRPGRGRTFINSTPDLYKEWLKRVCEMTLNREDFEKRLVFINAWNEWGEGAYLEPDRKYGYAYLQATAETLLELKNQV